jgi:glycosyltransferase involved in cell wall biosynthesis
LPERLSAVVLTYRKGWFLPRFLASLMRQSRAPDQVVVVDDASEDGTDRALALFPSSCEVVRLAANGGQSRARNLGVLRCEGDLVAFLDADIEMAPDMLAVLEAALRENPAASFAYGHYGRLGALRGEHRAPPWCPDLIRRGNYVSAVSLVRRAHLPEPPFDAALRSLEDWDLWLTMAGAGRAGTLVDRRLFDAYYRAADVTPSGDHAAAARAIRKKHGLPVTAGTP